VKKIYLILILVFFLSSPSFSDIYLDERALNAIEVMEGRLFRNEIEFESNSYRIIRLERELLGKTYEEDSLQKRIKRLEVASQKRTLTGAAVPTGWNRKWSLKRMNNELTPDYDDDVGIIDGLLKVFNPEAYEDLRQMQEFNFKLRYDDALHNY